MKYLIRIICIMFMTNQVWALEEIYQLGDKYLPVIINQKNHTTLSKNCESKKCTALKILKEVSIKKIDSQAFSGGKNPGAVICSSTKEGKVIYLKDLSGNENTFCIFADKSMASSGTLEFYARKNDGEK